MTSFQGLGTRERRRVLRARAAHARVGSLRLLRFAVLEMPFGKAQLARRGD
jgi:hypothetical protein